MERLHDWLFSNNTLAADRLLDVLGQALEDLADLSDRGRRVDRDGLRELIVPFGGATYVIRYEVDPEGVFITRIWHSLEHR